MVSFQGAHAIELFSGDGEDEQSKGKLAAAIGEGLPASRQARVPAVESHDRSGESAHRGLGGSGDPADASGQIRGPAIEERLT